MMLDTETLQRYDSGGMYLEYARWPQIAREAYYDSGLEPVDFEGVTDVVFSGMGGSGAIGDLLLSVLSKTSMHVNVVKGYKLPNAVAAGPGKDTLVVATSISGNTYETLGIMREARDLGCRAVGFSSGGRLEEFCTSHGVQHRCIPMYKNPRASFTAYVYSILGVLGSVIPVDEGCIRDSILQMEDLSGNISHENLTDTNASLRLAEWIAGGIPKIYYPWGLQAAAIRFKNSIQENMKGHAMIEDVIEASHNGIVSWERDSAVRPVLVRGADDHTRTKERWGILKEYFTDNGIEFWEQESVCGGVLSKIINLVYVMDLATVYGAALIGVDPEPVRSIDFVKERLGRLAGDGGK